MYRNIYTHFPHNKNHWISLNVIFHLVCLALLKEVLLQVTEKFPYRGPKIYTKGDYHYHCKVDGEFVWFQGYEDIFYLDEKIYECS